MMKHANSRLTTTTTPQAALLLTMTILAGLVFSKNQVSLAAPNQQEIGFKTTNTPTSSLHSHTRLTAQLFPSKTVSRRQLPLSGTPRANSTRHTHHGNKADSFRRAAAANEPRDLRPPWQA